MNFRTLARRIARIVRHGQPAILAMALVTAARPGIAQEIWFAPNEPRAPHTHLLGVSDWAALFEPGAPWKVASAGTHVFHIGTGYVIDAPDADLLRLKADIARRGMAIEIGIQAVTLAESDHCGRTEGYADLRVVTAVLDKLKRLGVIPAYITMDEPVWFGHYATGPKDCRFPIEEVARRTAETVRRYTEAFPAAVVGDIDNIPVLTLQPDWKQSYLKFKSALEHDIGRKLQYMQLDVDWRSPDWPEHMASIAQFAKSLGLKFGIIYNGDARDLDNASWIAHAERNFTIVESEYNIIPDQAFFATWNKFPTAALPETSPSAHTWLIKQYLLPRSRFTIDASARELKGRLVTQYGRGIAGAAVQVDVLGGDPNEYPAIHEITGKVPPDAYSAIIAVRINRECLCSGDNDVLIGEFSYSEHNGGRNSFVYSLPADMAKDRRPRTDGVLVRNAQIERHAVTRVTVPSNRTFGANSVKFDVTPGSGFTFKVPMESLTDKGVFGTAAIIWVDNQGHGLGRTNLGFEPEVHRLTELNTDATGHFETKIPRGIGGAPVPLRLHYAGTSGMRGAYAEVK